MHLDFFPKMHFRLFQRVLRGVNSPLVCQWNSKTGSLGFDRSIHFWKKRKKKNCIWKKLAFGNATELLLEKKTELFWKFSVLRQATVGGCLRCAMSQSLKYNTPFFFPPARPGGRYKKSWGFWKKVITLHLEILKAKVPNAILLQAVAFPNANCIWNSQSYERLKNLKFK